MSSLLVQIIVPIPTVLAEDSAVKNIPYTLKGTINGCGTMQGGASDGQYLYYICVTDNDSRLRIVKVTPDGSIVNQSKKFTRGQLGHGNDMTYNSKLKLLVVGTWDKGGGKSVKFIDPNTYEIKKTMSTNDGSSTSNICYNSTTDQYVLGGKIYDANFKYSGKRLYTPSGVDDDANTTEGKVLNQGIECDASYIYVMRVVWGERGYNIIAAYDWTGKNVGAYKVADLNDEGENMAILNGVFYMGVNEGGMSSGGNFRNDYFVQLNGVIGTTSSGSNNCSTSLTPAEKERDQTWNNEFWDKTNQCTCSEANSSGMIGNTNFKKIATYFSSKGLGVNGVAGVLANFNTESPNYSAFRIQGQNSSQDGDVPAHGGYGIAQFTPTTKIGKVLKSDIRTSKSYEAYYTRKYGGPPNAETGIPEGVPVDVNDAFLEVELDYIYSGELKTTTAKGRNNKLKQAGVSYVDDKDTIFDALKKTEDKDNGEKDAAKIFMILYERPASTMDSSWNIGAINGRGDMASKLLGDASSALGVAGNSAAACVTAAGASGNFSETVKAFAWEDGRRGSEQKPAYTAALKGRYKGGNRGNDCGAFVSALMVKSGFEPNYPGTSTTGQKPWLDKNWEKLYSPGQADTSKLRAGDVAIVAGSHVFVWIGSVDGFQGKSAEAALGSNTAPTAILDSNTFSAPTKYTWYRKKI
ncbi:hypothetical protein EYC58_01990 [Candidatus Saccharibacteria bacterium]|nr:MAG: hypothetical protein EYC58_01990 [Candidatus Saccharibacteria bacterium]